MCFSTSGYYLMLANLTPYEIGVMHPDEFLSRLYLGVCQKVNFIMLSIIYLAALHFCLRDSSCENSTADVFLKQFLYSPRQRSCIHAAPLDVDRRSNRGEAPLESLRFYPSPVLNRPVRHVRVRKFHGWSVFVIEQNLCLHPGYGSRREHAIAH